MSVTSLPERSSKPPGVSYTSLHEYWNDPNFDTQSRNSNLSSSTKKRRAPLAPGRISPSMFIDPATTVNIQRNSENHHQSHESLTDSQSTTKQKRKAPVPPTNNTNSSTGNKSRIEDSNSNEVLFLFCELKKLFVRHRRSSTKKNEKKIKRKVVRNRRKIKLKVARRQMKIKLKTQQNQKNKKTSKLHRSRFPKKNVHRRSNRKMFDPNNQRPFILKFRRNTSRSKLNLLIQRSN